MPAFIKKLEKFGGRGLNFNRAIDTVPEGQYPLALNVRSNQQGETTSRPGLTSFATLTGSPSFTHSISRLNNYSGNLPFFTYVFVVGADGGIWVGKTGTDLANGAINPIKLPPSGSTGTMSGNPLTMVDTQPQGGVSGWKYVGDSSQMLSVGYYPGDTPGTNMARALTMGMIPPVFNPFPITVAAGLLNGTYQWVTVYRNTVTGATSNPSAASRTGSVAPVGLVMVNQKATFTLPTTPIDPQTGSADTHIVVDVYRFGGTVNSWRYIGWGNSGASFTDNLPDSGLLSSPGPSQIVDPITGLSRFNLFKPFPVGDITRFSTSSGTVTALGGSLTTGNLWILTAGGGDTFNTGILPGSSISIGGFAWTVYQVRSSTVIEITEDAYGVLTSGGTYPWAIDAGTLIMGTPCPHIWGPFGTGNAGAVIFGCGAANAPGTLFWTNGNDPDSSDIANSLVVTSPSEPLRGGCVYNGVGYVWSTERMFRIYPQGNLQYFTQEIAGGAGLWMEWSLNVQSNSISDQSISWRGKDGIYNYTEGGGTQCITNDALYPFFPHENQAGTGIGTAIGASNSAGTIFPALNSVATQPIPPPDDTQPKYHRLTWFQGYLYYDYPGLVDNATKFRTLVYDTKETQGWVSADSYINTGASPVMRSAEIAGNNLKVGRGGSVYDWGGANDAGNAILCQVTTRQDDCGASRDQKLFGDLWFDADPGGSGGVIGIDVIPRVNYAATVLPDKLLTVSGRAQAPIDLSASGLGILSRTFGLDIQWTATGAATVLYQYGFSYVPKPEILLDRALDKTDDGYVGSKYLRGFTVECNTFGSDRKVNVLVDGVKATNPVTSSTVFTVNANGQLEVPFAIAAFVGHEFQLAIDSTDSSTSGWEIFQVRWIYEQWPELLQQESAVIAPAGGRLAYLRGFTVPMVFSGTLNLRMLGDTGTVTLAAQAAPASGDKTGVFFPVISPFIVREIQFVPDVAIRAWWSEIQWDMEIWQELSNEFSPWLEPAGGKPFYLRGFTIPVCTDGGNSHFTLKFDDGTTATPNPNPFNTPVALKSPIGMSLTTPHVAHSVQFIPAGAGTRAWWNEIKWDAEEWPERIIEFYPFQDLGTTQTKYVRSVEVPVETGGSNATLILSSDAATTSVFPPVSTANQVKSVFPFVLPSPVVAHEFQLVSTDPMRVWFQEAKWDFEVWPELSAVISPWINVGDPGAKFLQGFVIPLDTNGQPISLALTTDGGNYTFAPVSTPAMRKTPLPFSLPAPIICHEMQLKPSGNCRCWFDEIKWIWEPIPELTYHWITQETNHDIAGFHYFGPQAFLAYIGGSDQPTMTVTTQYGSVTYALPASNGAYIRAQIPMQPQKAKWRKYELLSSQGIRLYLRDTAVAVQAWGGNGPFRLVQPFGDLSRAVGARI